MERLKIPGQMNQLYLRQINKIRESKGVLQETTELIEPVDQEQV